MSIDSDVVLQILKRSPQGFTPFEILEELLTQPPYQGFSRASLYSKLLPKLQNLRDSQVVAHVSPRWMLVEFLENKPGEVNSQFEGRVNSQKSDETEGLNFPNQSEQATSSHLQESTPNVNDRDLFKNREATLFSFDDVKQETNRDFKSPDGTPIEILNLSTLCHCNLKRAGIDTIEKIQAYSDKDLLSIRNFGSKSLDEVKKALGKWESLPQDVKQENKHDLKYPLSSPLQILNLSSHTHNTLKRAGIDTIEELQAYSNEDLLGIKNFGQKLLSEVRNALANFKHLPTSAPSQDLVLLRDWAKHPVFQLSTSHLSLSTELNNILNRFPTVAQLLCNLEADNIAPSLEEKAQIKKAIAPFQELRDAPQSYLDWLASLSQTTRIKVLTKYKWTPARLEELQLSPQEIMSVIPSVEREKTRHAILLGTIPSKSFATVAEEIDNWLHSLNEREKFIWKQHLGLQDGKRRTFEDIGQELNITRERVRQIDRKAKTKLDAINNEIFLLQLRTVAIDTLHTAGCISNLDNWCGAIAKIYPAGKINLPSVISWFVKFVSEIRALEISNNKLFYIEPLTRNILVDIQAHIKKFWKRKKICEPSQLHQVILPLLPGDISHPEQVANTLIKSLSEEPIPGILSAGAWNMTDYAYYVLHEAGKPLHFSEIGQRIKQLKLDGKADNIERSAQGLVERHPDIIRCGSGIYGLREWGTMEYGHFREVLLDYLSQQPLPVDAEDIYAELSQSYAVTRSTVTMNLSDHPNLFKKFGRSSFYGIVGRCYELPDQHLVNLLVSKLENHPVTLSELEQDLDLSKYERKIILIYLNVSPLFEQIGSNHERKFALSIEGKRQYQPGDAAKIIADIFQQIREPLHARDFSQLVRNSYTYPPGESTLWQTIAGDENYIKFAEAIFIPRDWMSDETLGLILEDLDTELFREIVLFTLGSNRKQPRTDTLFEWLNFCYRNRFFYRGSLVYAQINVSELSDKNAQIARKIGQVCQRNGDISVLDLGQDVNSEEIDRTLPLDIEDLRQQAQSRRRTPSKGLASIQDGKYRVRYVQFGVEVHLTKWGGTDNPCARVLKVLVNGEPFDPGRHNPILSNTAPIDQRREALKKLYGATLTAYGQVNPYLQIAIGPRPNWGGGYRNMEPITEPATGDDT